MGCQTQTPKSSNYSNSKTASLSQEIIRVGNDGNIESIQREAGSHRSQLGLSYVCPAFSVEGRLSIRSFTPPSERFCEDIWRVCLLTHLPCTPPGRSRGENGPSDLEQSSFRESGPSRPQRRTDSLCPSSTTYPPHSGSRPPSPLLLLPPLPPCVLLPAIESCECATRLTVEAYTHNLIFLPDQRSSRGVFSRGSMAGVCFFRR